MTPNLLDNNSDLPTIDPNKNYVEELVGEGKKFKTIEDLARGKYEADAFLKTMQMRQDELRKDYLKVQEEAESRAKLADLIDQLSKRQTQSSSDFNHNANDLINEKPGLKPEDVESLIDARLVTRETQKRYSDNYNLVKAKLQERFGNNYQSTVSEQIEDLGITSEEFTEMARRSPKVLLKTLGLDQPVQREQYQNPLQSQQRGTFKPTSNEKRTWSYYQNLKKNDPKSYSDPKTTVQMHKDYAELGASFEDGDFHS